MTSVNQPLIDLPDNYVDWVTRLKGQVVQAQQRSALDVNAEPLQLYGCIGQYILQLQQTQVWGAKVIDRLARELKDPHRIMRSWLSNSLRNLHPLPIIAQLGNLVSSLLAS